MEPTTGNRTGNARRRGARSFFALTAAVLGAAAVVGAIVALAHDGSPKVRRNVLVNRPAFIDANNSPSVARNPVRAENLVIAHRVDRPSFSAMLNWSLDGGATWEPTPLPLPSGKDRAFGPDVAFAPDGTLYVAYVNLEGTGNVPDTLWLAKSNDGGRTLGDPVRVAGSLTFQPRIAVGPNGRVHLSWLQADDVGLLKLTGRPAPVVVATSTDGGRTFSAPIRASDPARERVGAASPVVDSAGDLVVLYQDFKGDRRDFENLEGPPWEEPFSLVVTRSGDDGRSFSRGIEVDSGLVPTRRFLVFLPEFPSLAAGLDRDLYVAWADGRHGDLDVFVRRSANGGLTWSPPVRANDNRMADRTSQYLPKVSVAADGRVDVVFLDRRRDSGDVMTDAFLAYSDDDGRSFRNLRISTDSFDSGVGPSAAPRFGVDLGSRLGLHSTGAESVAAWTDTRFGDERTGRQDVMAAVVELPGAVPPIGRWPVLVGAVSLSLLALLTWWALGRRDGELKR